MAGAVGSMGTLQPVLCLLKAGMFPLNETPELHSVLGDMEVIFSFPLPGLLYYHRYCAHWLYLYLYIVGGGGGLFLLNLE